MGETTTVDVIALYNARRDDISVRTTPRLPTVLSDVNEARIRTIRYDLRDRVTGAFSTSYFSLVPVREGVPDDDVLCIASVVGRVTLNTETAKIESVNVFTKAMEDDLICNADDAKASELVTFDDVPL